MQNWGDHGAYEGIDVDSLGTIYPFLSRPMKFGIRKEERLTEVVFGTFKGRLPDGSMVFDSLVTTSKEVEDAHSI